jgi:hypothetical protein
LQKALRQIWISGLMCVLTCSLFAQPSALIKKKIAVQFHEFELDSLTIISPTLRCISDTSIRFSFNFKTNKVRILNAVSGLDSLDLEYGLYPFAAYKPIKKFGLELYDSLFNFADYPGIGNQGLDKREELFSLPGIQKSGAISRGISLGNNQNGFVNSSLNLQLEGQITPEIKLTAVLSDQNVPFQPQGNTQQIRELDRIFIQLDHKRGQLIAGDVVLKNEPSQFLRYFKNIQGGQFSAYWDSTAILSKTRIGAGVAKGKFASIVVQVREGVQGPYRLRPPNVTDFLVVILANSERIYFDNRLLKRGFNQDYVIDYNTGELTLNNNLLVTQFTRLRCDFEYAERNYSRTSFLAEHEENIDFAKVRLSHYQEQDNGTRPLSFTLDSTSSKILSQAGDDFSKAILPSAQPVESFSEGQLLYVKRDTVLNGSLISFFKLAGSKDVNLFQVTFSEIGIGRGDYELIQNLGNGKAFQFVGLGLGRFLPVRQAVLPNLRSMSRASVTLSPGKGHQIETELAVSRLDKNRLSRLDEEDNQGNAQFVAYQWKPERTKQQISPNVGLSYTRLSKRFSAIDRFRSIEFERDWSANSGDTLAFDDHLIEANAGLSKSEKWSINYRNSFREKGENVNGFQQNLDASLFLGPVLIQNQAFTMTNKRADENSTWNRLQSEISLPGNEIIPGYRFNLDENAIKRSDKDSVLRTAMNFQSHTLFLKNKDSTRQVINLLYTYREDKLPNEGALEKSLFSQNVSARLGKNFSETQQVNLYSNYRVVNYANQLTDEENISGRIDYVGSFWDGAMRQEVTYTANTGQEQKRTFQFIKINAVGEGTHQWVDYNNNGLQELDEFVEAIRPEDKVYIKIFTPTNEFIKAFTNGLNYRLNLAAPASWRFGGGFKALVSKFALLTSIVTDQKSVSGSLEDRYLPFRNTGRESVLASTQVLRNTIFWNRTQSSMGADYSYLESKQKTLLSNGFSLRELSEHRLLFRKNIGSFLNLSNQVSFQERRLRSDALAAQNYRIQGFEAGPEFSFQPNVSNRITSSGQYGQRKNAGGEETTQIWKLGLEYRFNQQSNRTLNAFLRFTKLEHKGNDNSPAAYEMLEGLRPGQNLTWTLNVQQKLTQGLQILLSYEGRKSEGLRVIHLGKMQANLLF